MNQILNIYFRVQNGVLISFMNMNSTSYDSESDTITLLPGIHWGDATSALQQYGVAPVGGRIAYELSKLIRYSRLTLVSAL